MPRRVYRRRNRRPRNVRRRRAGKRSITMVPRGLNPVALRYVGKMKYSETFTTDVDGQYIYRLNGLFDPNQTGVGHQPYGFDSLANLYNRYRVIACGWRIERAMLEGGNPLMIGSIPSNDAGIVWNLAGGFSHMRECPRSKYVIQNAGAPVKVLSGKSYLPSLVGRSKAQYMADDAYQSTVVAVPTEATPLYILTYNTNDTPAPGTSLNIVLEYTVEFFDVKRQVQS